MKDKIIDYLQDELSPTERRAFEQALAADPNLRTELAFQKDKRDQLRAAQIRKEMEGKFEAWETGAAVLRNQDNKVVRLRVIAGGFALAASLIFVVFNLPKDQNEPVATQKAAPPGETLKSEIAIHKDSAFLKSEIAQNKDSAAPNSELRTPNSEIVGAEIKKMPPPAGASKSNAPLPVKKKPSATPQRVVPPVLNEWSLTPSSNIATTESKSEGGFLSGAGGSDTNAQNTLPKPIKTALDSTLHIPVKSLISEAALLQRLETATLLKGNKNLQSLVNQYFIATKDKENLELSDSAQTDTALIAAFWLLKAMHNFETIGDKKSVAYCLGEIPTGFFVQEKKFYEQLLDIPKHQNSLKTIIQQLNHEPLNIHYEKSLQLAPYFN